MKLTAFLRSPCGIASLAAALVSCSAGALLDPASIAAWMAHPARIRPDGSLPATTIEGAALLRLALIVAPVLLVACQLLIVRVARPMASLDGSSTVDHDDHGSRRATLLLVGIVAVGIMVRVPLLGQSLWYDEIVPFGGYSLLGPGPTIGNYYSQANHVFSQLLLWCSTAMLGADEFSMRLPALLASLFSIVAVWGAARTTSDERTALTAAATMALLPLNVLAGTDARGYALAIAGAAGALWAAARARRSGSPVAWSAMTLCVAFAAWAHLVAILFALGLGLAWAIGGIRGVLRRSDASAAAAGLIALVASAILTLALYAPILPDILALRSQFGHASAGVPSLAGPETWHALIGLGGAWTWWAAIPGGLLAVLGALSLARQPALRHLIIAGLLGFPLAFAVVALADSWLYARFLLFVVPAIALLIAAGTSALARRRAALGGVAFLLFATVSVAHLLLLPPRQPLREALIAARALSPAGAPIGLIGLRDNPLAYYALVQRVELVDFGDRGANLERGLERGLERVQPTAIVVLYPASLPASVRATLTAHGYRTAMELPGWIDWGAGAVEVLHR